jgi:hypothetical protein
MSDLVRTLPDKVKAPWQAMVFAAISVKEARQSGVPNKAAQAAYVKADHELWKAVQAVYGRCTCSTDPAMCPSVDVHEELYSMVSDVEE